MRRVDAAQRRGAVFDIEEHAYLYVEVLPDKAGSGFATLFLGEYDAMARRSSLARRRASRDRTYDNGVREAIFQNRTATRSVSAGTRLIHVPARSALCSASTVLNRPVGGADRPLRRPTARPVADPPAPARPSSRRTSACRSVDDRSSRLLEARLPPRHGPLVSPGLAGPCLRPGSRTTRWRSARTVQRRVSYRYHPHDDPVAGRRDVVASSLRDGSDGSSTRDASGRTTRRTCLSPSTATPWWQPGPSSYQDRPGGFRFLRVYDNCWSCAQQQRSDTRSSRVVRQASGPDES